jgi:S-adenosylmethionine-diacylglycerol 3-amino-3-carboxypropyl transferase
MRSEAASHADFSDIRYAQCWEDADVLLEALDIQPGDTCLSIASAGDNALALLTRSPGKVVALDLSPAQLACLELRVAAYRALTHPELLELIGSRPSRRRLELYALCRPGLTAETAAFWDARKAAVEAGIGSAGKFERYFALFRTKVLPLVHSRGRIDTLLRGGTLTKREAYYDSRWDTARWRLLFRIFFSRTVMGRFGRSPSFFKYVQGDVAGPIKGRVHHALTQLDPSENPYLQWILKGTHVTALPAALRRENFDLIRANLDRIEWHNTSIEEYLDTVPDHSIDRFNLSDIFEYMSPERTEELLARLARAACPGGRLAYWNMLAPRSRPESLADRLRPLPELANRLHALDKAFFYSAFVVEEVV